MDLKKNCQCEFGENVESRDDYVVTNDMKRRTHESIAIGPSGNLQDTHKVFYLKTGLVLKRRVNTFVSMPDQVIKK